MRPITKINEARGKVGGINFVGMMNYPDFDPNHISHLEKKIAELESRLVFLEQTWWQRIRRWIMKKRLKNYLAKLTS